LKNVQSDLISSKTVVTHSGKKVHWNSIGP